jgi:S-adenosylmethionine synthetase
MKRQFLFTSESVTDGHPDRICDSIADALVDRFLRQDPYSRVIAECAISKGIVFIAARLASLASVDLPDVVRSVIARVGYRPEDFNVDDCTVVTSLINMPLEHRPHADERELSEAELDRLFVHNQATVFGFACNQTPELMPLPIVLANRLARRLADARRRRLIASLSPDCTTQVGIEYNDGKPMRIHGITIIAGQEGGEPMDPVELREELCRLVVHPALAEGPLAGDDNTEVFVNPQGAFPRSGPASHSGMTGRKTAAETYGGYARHSGSALSGKDPSRIDRIGAYAARYAAKNVVAAGLAEACEVQLSYSIGHAGPVSIQVNTLGTHVISQALIQKRVQQCFDFRLGAIIRDLRLRHLPAERKGRFYSCLPVQGHFDNTEMDLPWERTDRAESLRD